MKQTREMKKAIEKELEARGLWSIPTCKVCHKTPDKITEYKYQDNPVLYVLETERLTRDGRFYCTTCYVKAGMPLF
jgi:hypothetical protein